MGKLENFESFIILNEVNSEVDIDESIIEISEEELNDLYEKIEDGDIDKVQTRNLKSQHTGKVIAWVLFFPIALMWELKSTISKKIRIQKLINKEEDPVKKVKLKEELKALQQKEVRYLSKIEKAKSKAKKKSEKIDAKALKGKEKEIEKKKAEFAKAKEEIKDTKTEAKD